MFKYEDLLGIPFRYGGRGNGAYDCYGLCMEIYRRLGHELPEYASTSDRSLINQSINQGKDLFDILAKPEPYCIVTFTIRPPYTSHLGVVLGDARTFIHIMAQSSVTIERLDSLVWKNRITGFYRLKPR